MISYEFESAFEKTVGLEGGYTNNPNDLGGPTNYGITQIVAKKHGYTGDMKDLPLATAKIIYQLDYWNPLRLDDVSVISKELSIELFDTGVNQGVVVAGKHLQRSLNVLNRQAKDYIDLVMDGNIGPKTIDALRKYYGLRGKNGVTVLYRMLNCLQGARYVEIAEAREANEEFMFGWFLNRIN